ncbi:diguanylate cyclase [Methylocaldum sp.]|uniref:sensor domain-containing diguanylate cyclase n=1 Tax=Methylocaldum sp. TaxID=1969727 RepID=UPI002D3240B1|nr:diguanylate cyclase [Methylocaldum sp.]HYE38027.1 diguanylate cyclase [Methylocaldum sp.]
MCAPQDPALNSESPNPIPDWKDQIPIPLLVLRLADKGLVFLNRSARELFGDVAKPGVDASVLFDDPNALLRLLESLQFDEKAIRSEAFLKSVSNAHHWHSIEASAAEMDGERVAVLSMIDTVKCIPNPREAEFRSNIALWRGVFDQAAVGIALLDKDLRFIEVNRRWLDMFGYSAEEMGALSPSNLTPVEDCSGSCGRIDALLMSEVDQYRVGRRLVRKDGSLFWGDLSVSILRDGEGAVSVILAFLIDITDRKLAEDKLQASNERLEAQLAENRVLQEKLRDLAVRDPLTALFNRRYMEETLRRELSRSAREDQPLSLVMIDIDHFKQLNDTYGHPAGDLVLKELAALLLRHLRSEDIVCRFGGEEFVAILPGAPLTTAAQRAESWRLAFQELRIEYEDQVLTGTLSMGIAEYPRHGATGEDLLFQADSAMYMAKRAGRNRVMVWG